MIHLMFLAPHSCERSLAVKANVQSKTSARKSILPPLCFAAALHYRTGHQPAQTDIVLLLGSDMAH